MRPEVKDRRHERRTCKEEEEPKIFESAAAEVLLGSYVDIVPQTELTAMILTEFSEEKWHAEERKGVRASAALSAVRMANHNTGIGTRDRAHSAFHLLVRNLMTEDVTTP